MAPLFAVLLSDLLRSDEPPASDLLLSALPLLSDLAELSALPAQSDFVSPDAFASAEAPDAESFAASALPAAVELRESVLYQPEPLKRMPTGCNTFRTGLPQSGQEVTAASLKV